MSDLSVSYTAAGLVPQTPESLRGQLVLLAVQMAPDITTELPGSLIEDIVSTDTGALLIYGQAKIDLTNSVGPLKANIYMFNLLTRRAGIVPQKTQGATTVPVRFNSPAGFDILQGFVMSDEIYAYTLNDATIIPSSGVTPQVACTATTTGSWAIPTGTTTQIITSVPDEITLTRTNPVTGVPDLECESNYQFRNRVWESQMSTAQGYPDFIRQELTDVNGMQARLVSIVQNGNSWIIMCGGGDTYGMAGAIFKSAGDISRLERAAVGVTDVTNANPGVVTTGITHGLTNGQVVNISGVNGMTGANNVPLNTTALVPHTSSIDIDASASGLQTGGGGVTPNIRNNVVTMNDWSDSYLIPSVVPLQQDITVKFEQGSEGVNYLTNATILTLISTPVIRYINGIYTDKPLNINNLKDIFLQSVNIAIDISLISKLNIIITVNGIVTNPDPSTNIISSGPFSYFCIASNGVTTGEVRNV